MLKKIFTATLLFISLSTYAYPRYGSSCPKFYLGLSTGIDNPSGFIGLNADVPLSSHFSLGAGGGLSLMWGYKAYAEGRFFFRECNRGFAFGAGATYNSGIKNVTIDANTNIGNAPVTMTLDPVITAMASGYYFFSLGERHMVTAR